MSNLIKISVRNLVEFVLRTGDIDTSFMSMSRAVEGTKAHQKVQNSYGYEYQKEVTLKHNVYYDDFTIQLEGRADGILTLGDEIIVDEIKSTTKDLEDIKEDYNELHWAQAKCYGYIYCLQNNLDNIYIQLTYFHIESEERKIFKREYTKEDLEKFFLYLTDKYIEWASITFYWGGIRDKSIEEISFPFKNYRKGQRELAVATYKTIKEGKKLFAQAPTGIGKTMSTLFPSIKAIGEGTGTKIFYLTAKTITREVPIASTEILIRKGLRVKVIVITAKEKICANEEVKCNPRDCSFAKGHYDRVNEAIMDIFENEDLITRDTIVSYGLKHNVCPFEFSLDISLWADIIICDYNYVFNPQVYLKRFFENPNEDYIFLIDESHNLVDRSREMFSTEINKSSILGIRDIFKENYPPIYKALGKINSILNKVKDDLDIDKEYYQREEISDLYYPIKRVITVLEPWLMEEKKHSEYEKVLELYFNLTTFVKISELYDSHYVTYIKEYNKDIIFKLYCVDSSYLLREALERGRSSIFFSATLTPLDYHMELLGGKKDDYHIKLSSPFSRENLCLMVANSISTRYKDRERTYIDIVRHIETFIYAKKGNYFVFFPSYVYMTNVYEILMERNENLNIIIQDGNMSEIEREEFLLRFEEGNELIAFAVMGGIFSEGIDLTGEKLIGAIIVGVGLPQICFERNIIKDYFTYNLDEGFEYAYVYPGMNKVLQSAGRVIRSPEDRGAVLLIDDRYGTREYRALFPNEWLGAKNIRTDMEMKRILERFW
ncbi:ATP-dependent DNA helicase [Tissierella pigra]|uniref:ATP-dependent DNA helicase n=1 Tax=Tissierella pigra TaxID=2607614 RepID=A0A6N7XNK8_9FIRM|nr:ATP-dependent DNA helicase [Tissierella pigra]MBU5427011.1 ATP-dependent DNA helicase [Tissierella pigra]MSU02392.1 ATP-dependent DNA helicase [Tissierella pigra]